MTPSLTPAQLDELQEMLMGALAKLERSMAVSDEASKPVELDQTSVGRLSRMDSLQNQAMSSNLKDRERARLASILEALERMEEGRYGVCTGCGEAIQVGRLMVFPETATCSGCAG